MLQAQKSIAKKNPTYMVGPDLLRTFNDMLAEAKELCSGDSTVQGMQRLTQSTLPDLVGMLGVLSGALEPEEDVGKPRVG